MSADRALLRDLPHAAVGAALAVRDAIIARRAIRAVGDDVWAALHAAQARTCDHCAHDKEQAP